MTTEVMVPGKEHQEGKRTSIWEGFLEALGWGLLTGISPEACLLFQKQNLTQILLIITCHFAQTIGPMLTAGNRVLRSKSSNLS